jgi:hypothetical protein
VPKHAVTRGTDAVNANRFTIAQETVRNQTGLSIRRCVLISSMQLNLRLKKLRGKKIRPRNKSKKPKSQRWLRSQVRMILHTLRKLSTSQKKPKPILRRLRPKKSLQNQ